MLRLLFDMEGDGLNPTRFWCSSILDLDAKELTEYGPNEMDKAMLYLNEADVLVGHNIIGYDLPYIAKLHGYNFRNKELVDTLVLSRLYSPNREGGHSLGAWGYKLGYAKVEHEDWSKFSAEMQHRCSEDVRLNYKVLKALEKEGRGYSKECVKLEHQTAIIIYDQIQRGWLFNTNQAVQMLATVRDSLGVLEDEVHRTFLPKKFPVKVVIPKVKKDGTLSKSGLRTEEYKALIDSGSFDPFTRYETKVFNLASRAQIGIWLKDFGWKPTKFTDKGQPKVDEKILSEITGFPEADLINQYLSTSKIRGFLDNWIDSVDDDGRQHGFVNPIGAITGRMTHSRPNLGQVPAKGDYGPLCRDLFGAAEGYKLVGMDADGLELRMLAHYMKNKQYILAVNEGDKKIGTDAHSVNMNAAGLNNRDQAKTMFYALIYGAGDGKLGKIVGGGAKEGRLLKSKLFAGLPDLGDLIERVITSSGRGVLKSLDGRLIHVRSPHSSLNTLLQGGGAVVMKQALVLLDQYATEAGLDYYFVGNIHDEIQAEVADADVDKYSELAVKAMKDAGEHFNMKCPLKGDVKVGNTWKDTH